MIIETPGRALFRLTILAFLICLAIGKLFFELYRLQVGQMAAQSKKATLQSTKTIVLPPARGLVFDRWGQPLAELRPSIDIDVYLQQVKTAYLGRHPRLPKKIVQVKRGTGSVAVKVDDIVAIVDDVIGPLKEVLGERISYDPEALELHQRIRDNIPFQLKSDLTFKEISILYERGGFVPGIEPQPRPVRRYAYGSTASHIVGYVGSPETAKTLERDGQVVELDTVGKDGVEKAYDNELQGSPGFRTLQVNNVGYVIDQIGSQFAKPGNAVYLTLDLRVQQIVERAMAGVGRGACVVLDATNGDILAMASVPNYDPNTVVTPEGWKKVSTDRTKPLLNRALGAYPPGSTFKIPIALAAMKYGTVTPRFSTNCGGGITVADRFRACWNKSGCGPLDMMGAIRRSCNTYFYTVGIKTGVDSASEVCSRLGLGHKWQLPLSNVSGGSIPSLPWMKKFYPKDRWSSGHMANMAIGQGYVLTTPLQMAVVAMATGNGGTVFKPRLVKEIRGPDDELIREMPTEIYNTLDIPPDKLEVVRRGMRAVVNEAGGTGKRAWLPDVVVAGKTGSAQAKARIGGSLVSDTKTWFISFVPYDKPRYAACVMVEGGISGGSDCAPLIGAIWRQIFDLEKYNTGFQLAYMQPQRGHYDGARENPNLPDNSPAPPPDAQIIHAAGDAEAELEQNEDTPIFIQPRDGTVRGGRTF